jgi:hypothetical protein
VWRKKEITPLSTPTQEEESLSPDSPDTQVQPEEEKSGDDSVPLDTPQVCNRARRSGLTDLNLQTFAKRLHW